MTNTTRTLALAATIGLLAGCSAGAGTGSRFLPSGSPASSLGAAGNARAAQDLQRDARRKGSVRFVVTVPRRRAAREEMHPSTISAGTQSIGFAVGARDPQIFTIAGSPDCKSTTSGTKCTFAVSAPIGTDSIVVTTYSGASASGAILDQGTLTIDVSKGKSNSGTVTLRPVVSNASDSGPGSLRYAIANADPGDTIMFLSSAFPTGTTIVLQSPIALEQDVTISGPGVTSQVRRGDGEQTRHPRTTYGGIGIAGGGKQELFFVHGTATVTISGLVLANGGVTLASASGGGLIHNDGTLTLSGDAIVGGVSSPSAVHGVRALRLPRDPMPARIRPHLACSGAGLVPGGGVFNDGTLAVSDTTFDSNVASSTFGSGTCLFGSGGAIFNDASGTLTVSGGAFVNNSAYLGGAVFNQGAASFRGVNFENNTGCDATNGCPTIGCSGMGCTNFATGNGAAVYDAAGPGVSIASSTFSTNVVGGSQTSTSSGLGGALFLAAGAPAIVDSKFTGNVAGTAQSNCSLADGGAIYASVPLTLTGDEFTGNVAGGDYGASGGAIYTSSSVSGSGDEFTGNGAAGYGHSTCAPDAAAAGGAVFASGGVVLSSSSFGNNTAWGTDDAYAGALYVNAPSTLSGSDQFQGNTAFETGAVNAANGDTAFGGAIFADAAATTLTVTGATFTANSITEAGTSSMPVIAGGAVYARSALASSGSTFTGNTLAAAAGANAQANGGAVFVYGDWTSSGDTFESNAADGASYLGSGGAAFANAGFNVKNDDFENNSASGAGSDGGAFFAAQAGAVSGSTFSSNAAVGPSGVGGAFYDNTGGVTIAGSTFSGNQATGWGGAIQAGDGDTLTLDTITGNQVTGVNANGYGGGGLVAMKDTIVLQCTISGNTVALNGSTSESGGGGILDYDGMILLESLVSNNAVTGSGTNSGGGGIYVWDVADAIFESTIANNTSSLSGGGIYAAKGGGPSLTNVTLYNNSANGDGGSIIGDGAGVTLALANSIVAAGSAGGPTLGPDIFMNGGSFTDGDYNIVQTSPIGLTLKNHDKQTDPLLDPNGLQNNGGPTMTIAETASSPGLGMIPFDASNDDACGTASGIVELTDQRGFQRAGTSCDVGAYDSHATASIVRSPLPARRHSSHARDRRPHPVLVVPPAKIVRFASE